MAVEVREGRKFVSERETGQIIGLLRPKTSPRNHRESSRLDTRWQTVHRFISRKCAQLTVCGPQRSWNLAHI